MNLPSECDIVKIGNLICEDESNVPECGFDGGDCCLKNSVKSNCTICNCHLNTIPLFNPCKYRKIKLFKKINNLDPVPDCDVKRIWSIGNGICSDELNNYPCNFDGGDCCIYSYVAHSSCDICACYWDTTNYPIIITPNTSKFLTSIVGTEIKHYYFAKRMYHCW